MKIFLIYSLNFEVIEFENNSLEIPHRRKDGGTR